MLSAYFLPLWHILLDAPQYPEGLEMKIWLHGLSGNICQINGLNHYIGMKFIVAGDFKEFKFLPYIFGALTLIGFTSAIAKSRKLLWIWFISLCLFAIIGFSDFYMWEYSYGHNLNPHAAIKVEGMNYQPPLFGYKQLLNFTAGSLPDVGGILVGLGGLLVAGSLFYEYRFSSKKIIFHAHKIVPILIVCLFFSCSRTPEPIQYGKDACAHCKMTIMDRRFAAEIITSKGKVFKFDATECMADFLKGNPEIAANKKSIFLVCDFNHPGQFVDARKSFFLNDNSVSSPMGGNLSAFLSEGSAEAIKKDKSAKIYRWSMLLKSR